MSSKKDKITESTMPDKALPTKLINKKRRVFDIIRLNEHLRHQLIVYPLHPWIDLIAFFYHEIKYFTVTPSISFPKTTLKHFPPADK